MSIRTFIDLQKPTTNRFRLEVGEKPEQFGEVGVRMTTSQEDTQTDLFVSLGGGLTYSEADGDDGEGCVGGA